VSEDLRDRLKRMGVHKGAGHLKPSPLAAARDAEGGRTSAQDAVPGPGRAPDEPGERPLWDLELRSAFGPAFVRRTTYPVDHRHGGRQLRAALDLGHFSPGALALQASGLPETIDLSRCVFLDTETTGLAGGAGTLAFLVGMGYFVPTQAPGGQSFVLDQFFLPDPLAEQGMLCAVDQLLGRHDGLVTFNGRGFDVPLLETRYALARIPPALSEKPNLDLLLPSRRLWRNALESCSLGSLEYHMLGIRRDQQDIPGFLIPQLYRDYLRTRATADMQRVLYHNAFDVLSMVTLAARIADAVAAPATPAEHLSIAVYYDRLGDDARAEAAYRAAASNASDASYAPALRRLAQSLKRRQRPSDALACWHALAEHGDTAALVELAKHFEWRATDLDRALGCARLALRDSQDAQTSAEIRHRIERLERKLAARQEDRP
jgi:uncharacterized protein YprB with RNaseH-like and TPR domain